MKKTRFTYYLICWAILVALFNVLCFVTPNEAAGMSKFGGAFWSGYICIMLAFIGQLACAWITFKETNLQKLFYNIPLIRISYTGTVLSVIVGTVCMMIPDLPSWVAIILCAIVLAFTVVAVVMAKAAADEIGDVDQKIKVQTFFIKSLTVDAQTLMQSAQSETVKKECEKVYEAIRYSDPMSNDALAGAEAAITLKFNEFSGVVKENDETKVLEIVKELLILIDDRNKKCKLLK